MKIQRFSSQVIRKSFLVMLLVVLALPNLGWNGLAVPKASVSSLQSGTPNALPLSCGPSAQTPSYCNIQIVLMLDDSGSMNSNDPGRLRNLGARNVVKILADQYYPAAEALHEDNPNFQLPDVRVAVIHFSEGVKKKSPWFSIDPNNVEGWKNDLFEEINWPEPDSKEYKDFYSKTQWTDFVEAFKDASQLLQLKDAKDVQGDCTRRSILLFTDGTPENARDRILTGTPLETEMKTISTSVSALNASMPDDSKPTIYVTGFQIAPRYEKPWNDVKAYWKDIVKIVKPDATDAEIEDFIQKVDTKGSLEKLPARMEEIVATLINMKRFAVNHAANSTKSYSIPVPSLTESIRFTLYNSDTAAKLEITDPDNIVITAPDAENPPEQSGAGTPIQVWQINNPKAGDYKVTVRSATRPGIITWLYAYKGLSAQFDNQPGSFEPGQPGDVKFRLVDSDGNVLSDQLQLKASVTQFGEQESPLAAPTQDGDLYTISWTPKTSRAATFKVTLSDGNNELLNCSLIFDLISTSTATPTSTPTATATVTSTATATPTSTPTEVPLPPVPVIAIFPECVSPGDAVTLPMNLQYGGNRAKLAALDWQGSTATLSDNQKINVSVNPLDVNQGAFQVVMGPVSAAVKSLQLHLKAQENAEGQSVPIFDVASTIPVSATCNVVVPDPCTSGLWGAWFWPLVIVLLGLMILLLVLRFRAGDDGASWQADRDVYRTRQWHLLFWPLLVLFVLLLLVRWMEWCATIPPWLFLVSMLVWLIFALWIRFFPGRNPSQPRPWWLLLLLVVLGFLGYVSITNPGLSLLWLLLFLLLAWVILWYLGPDDLWKPDNGPVKPPVSPADFNIQVGPPDDPQENGSVIVPVKLTFGSSDATMLAPEWHVRKWNVSVSSPDKELSWSVEPEGREPEGVKPGLCFVTIHGAGNDRLMIDVQADADVEVDNRVVKSAQATATIRIGSVMVTKVEEVIIPIPFPVPTPPPPPDDLTDLEGIGPDVAALLNEKGIIYFQQLALTSIESLNDLLDRNGLKMMDPKTWPQQAELADIAQRFGKEEDRQNYLAYKAWLRDGLEPDEYGDQEKGRRDTALIWNQISKSTPVVLRLALHPSREPGKPLTLPMQLKFEGTGEWLSAIEWNVNTTALPAGKAIGTVVTPVNAQPGHYELSIAADPETSNILLSIQALINGRSIEIFDPTTTIEIYPAQDVIVISPSIPPDDLTELEGIGETTASVLNAKGIFTFKQLAELNKNEITVWLNEAELRMLDPKTWPQQAKLADIAERYGKEEDRQNYLAYKAWLRGGIEPDEYDKEEKDRRQQALAWNRISECAPIILSLALSSPSTYFEEAIKLPLRLNHEGDQSWLAAVEWKVSAKAMPVGEEISTIMETTDAARGEFMLVIGPVQDTEAKEVHVVIQALLNGRSIEIFYGSAVIVQVTPMPVADPLEELEGIGAVVKKLLNENGVYTFEQLAQADVTTLNRWLNEKGYQRMDPKTWPQQAKLADIAYKYGREEDRQSYEAYKAWLVRGVEPDEVDKEEKDRRPVALAWPISPASMPDPLEELEGIGKAVAQVLNDNGIFTFRQLAKADIVEITRWLNECGYERMDPKTWPQQAKLSGIAREFGMEQDRRSYEAYKAWLKGGIEPDEYELDEKDRRPVALTWYGTAELTEKAYPEIFG